MGAGGWCSKVAVQHCRRLQWLLLLLPPPPLLPLPLLLLLLLLLPLPLPLPAPAPAAAAAVHMLGCRHVTVKLQRWSTTTRGSGGLLGGTVVSQTLTQTIACVRWHSRRRFPSHFIQSTHRAT